MLPLWGNLRRSGMVIHWKECTSMRIHRFHGSNEIVAIVWPFINDIKYHVWQLPSLYFIRLTRFIPRYSVVPFSEMNSTMVDLSIHKKISCTNLHLFF